MVRRLNNLNILLLKSAIIVMMDATNNTNSHGMMVEVDDGLEHLANHNMETNFMETQNDNNAITQNTNGNLLYDYMAIDFNETSDFDREIEFRTIVNFNQTTEKDFIFNKEITTNNNTIPLNWSQFNNKANDIENLGETFLFHDYKTHKQDTEMDNKHKTAYNQMQFNKPATDITKRMDICLNENHDLEFRFNVPNSHDSNLSDAIDLGNLNFEDINYIEAFDINTEINQDMFNKIDSAEMFKNETSSNAIEDLDYIDFTSIDVNNNDYDVSKEFDNSFDTYLDIRPKNNIDCDSLNITNTGDVLCFNQDNLLEKNKLGLNIINDKNDQTIPSKSSTSDLQQEEILTINDQKGSFISSLYEKPDTTYGLNCNKYTISSTKVDEIQASPSENLHNNQNFRIDNLVEPITQNVYDNTTRQNNDENKLKNKDNCNIEHRSSLNTVNFDLKELKKETGLIKQQNSINHIGKDSYQQEKTLCDQSMDIMMETKIKEIDDLKFYGNISLYQEKRPNNQGKKRKHDEELDNEISSTLIMKELENHKLYQGKLIKIPICESSGSLLLYMATIQNHLKNRKNFFMESFDPYLCDICNMFVQKKITIENLDNEALICKDYINLFDIILSQIGNTSFLKEYNKYKNGEEIQSQTKKNLFNLFNNSPFLYYDPFYIWKTYHTINLDILLFYYIQCSDDKILNIINIQEKMVIGKFFDIYYVKVIAPNYDDTSAFAHTISDYINCIINKTLNSNDSNYTKKIIPKTNIFTNACYNFVEKYNIPTLNITNFIYYFEQINEDINNYIIDDTFQFDMLFKIASIKASQIDFEDFQLKLIDLKIILIECLENASKDFLLFFPEIEVLIDYIKAFVPPDVEILENKELFTYLYMLRILTDFACYTWYDIYTNERTIDHYLHENEYISLHSAFFSLIKYEISKFISYCIIRFVSIRRYKLYAHIRILEKIFLCGYAQNPFKFRQWNYSADFHFGKFNFLIRFIFIRELDPMVILNSKYVSPGEVITFYCFEVHTKKDFLGFFTCKTKHLYAKLFLQRYVEIIRNNGFYNELIVLHKMFLNVYEKIKQKIIFKPVDEEKMKLLNEKLHMCVCMRNLIGKLFYMLFDCEKKHLLYGYNEAKN
ncbi:hypothetical protein COBT_000225 [Conglomerata obtusa]